MKITEHSHLLIPAIQDLATKNSIPYYDTSNGRIHGINLDNDNQCVVIKNNAFDICILSYKDISIFEKFLQLSSDTIQKLTITRQFLTALYGGDSPFENRLKIKFEHKKGVVFTINGSNLMSLDIYITDELVTVSLKNYSQTEKAIVALKNYSTIDAALFSALDDFIKLKLLSSGFSSESLSSEEVSTFLHSSLSDFIREHLSGLSVNVFERDSLISSICQDLSIDVNEIFNYKNNKQHTNLSYITNNTLEIPPTTIHILPKLIKKIIPNHESKMSQLMNLISLYYHLLSQDVQFLFSAKRLYKLSFVKPKEFDVNTNYYSFDFQSLVNISVGHNQEPDTAFDPVYLGDTEGNTFKFILWLDYSLDSINKGTRVTEYLTNDIDVIYDKLLASISNFINSKVDNVGKPITSQHLDLYKMLTI